MNSSGDTSAWRGTPARVPIFDLTVHGNNAAFGATTHDYVASGLANPFETEALKRSYDGST